MILHVQYIEYLYIHGYIYILMNMYSMYIKLKIMKFYKNYVMYL